MVLAFAAVVGLTLPPCLWAAQTEWMPSIAVRGEYDDNVEFEATDPDGDVAAWVSPGLALRRSTERSQLEGGATLDLVRYGVRTDLNRLDQLYRVSGSGDWTERFRVRGDASYREGSTIESQLDETGRVTRRSSLYQFRGGVGGTYDLSPRAGVGLDYAYFKAAYASGGQLDFDAHDVSLTWTVELKNERDRVSVRSAYRTYDSKVSDTDDVSLTVGWRHPVIETWVLDLIGGGRYTRFDTRDDKDQQWGGIVDLSSTWKGETWSTTVGVNADLTYGSEGIPVEVERVRGSVRRNVTERLWGALAADLARTRDLGSSGEDRLYASVSPVVGYRLGRTQTLVASYRYGYNRDESPADDEVATRRRVWVEWRGEW